MIRKFLAGAAVAALLTTWSMAVTAADKNAAGGGGATPAPAAAPSPAAMPPAPAASAAPAEHPGQDRPSEVGASGKPIALETGKGVLIHLPHPAATVFIANPEVADVNVKSPSLIYLTAKAPGDTALYAVDAQDHVLLNSPVHVEHDLSRVRQTLSAIAPGENVRVSSVDNSLVLSGNVSSAARAERLRSLAASIAGETKGTVVNRLSVATPNQVNIRVKIAEIDRNVLKALGVNWSKASLTGATGEPTSTTSFVTQNPLTSGAIQNVNELGIAFGTANSRTLVFLDALSQEGLVTTLAEPNLTATNGQPASFLAGGEFPVPVAGQAATGGGIPTITVAFKTFGVALDVTPTIVDPEHIILRIRPEVSQLTTTGEVSVPLSPTQTVTIPALTVRRADTTVELATGQSFLLGGLLQNTETQNISKVPGLGDIPVVGQLFRSEQFQRGESELVIVVTPYLVKPTVMSLAAPTDGFVSAHDAQKIISGDTYRQTLPNPSKGPLGAGGQGLVGTVGFRLD